MFETSVKSGTAKAFLTRIFLIFLGILAMVSGGNMGKLDMQIAGAVTTESEKIIIEIGNYTGKSIGLDEYFVLEINKEGDWIDIEQHGLTKDTAITVKNLGTAAFTIDIEDMFGKSLEAGEYRLTKNVDNAQPHSVVFYVTEA